MLCSRLAPPLCPQSGGPPACLRACEPQTPFSSGSLCCCPVCFTNRCRLVVQARLHHQRPQRAVRHRLPRARRGGAPDGRHLPRPRLRILRWVGGWLWVAGFVWLLGSFLGLACECCCLAGCIPAHLLSTEKHNTQHSTPPPPCPVSPHPAAGAGHKIIRCEVSLDDGKSWRLATETHNTPPNKYGKHWAWVWWSLDVPIGECVEGWVGEGCGWRLARRRSWLAVWLAVVNLICHTCSASPLRAMPRSLPPALPALPACLQPSC